MRAYGFAKYWTRAGETVDVLTVAHTAAATGLALPFEGFRVIPLDYPRVAAQVLRRLSSPEQPGAPAKVGFAAAAALRRLFQHVRARTGIYSSVRMPDHTDPWVPRANEWVDAQQCVWDCVITSSSPYTAHRVGLYAHRRNRARIWAADFRDPWTDNHAFPGLFPFTLFERAIERRCFRRAKLVTTIGPELAQSMSRRHGRRVDTIYNGHDPELCSALPPESRFPRDGRIRLVYTGTLYEDGNEPRVLLRALANCGDAGRRFTLVVAGTNASAWRELCKAECASITLEVYGMVSRREAWHMQRDAAALVLLDWRSPLAGVLTSKIFEYLFSPAPILGVGGEPDSPIGLLLRETGRGRHFGRAIEELSAFLLKLGSEEDALWRGRPDALRKYTREAQSRVYLDLLRETACR